MDQDEIVERYQQPLYKAQTIGNLCSHRASRENSLCGDEITMLIFAENGIIGEARWDGNACCLTSAVADALCERIIGLPLAEAVAVVPFTLVDIDISLNRRSCVTLPSETLREALCPRDC